MTQRGRVRVCESRPTPGSGAEANAELIRDRMSEAASRSPARRVPRGGAHRVRVRQPPAGHRTGGRAESPAVRSVRDACRELGMWTVFGAIERFRGGEGSDRDCLYNTAFHHPLHPGSCTSIARSTRCASGWTGSRLRRRGVSGCGTPVRSGRAQHLLRRFVSGERSGALKLLGASSSCCLRTGPTCT